MGNLSNLFISQSFISVLHTGNNNTLSAQYTDIQDGLGNSSGVSLKTNGDLSMSGSLTASLQQGYVWVGNASGRTTTVPTSSFGGGGVGGGGGRMGVALSSLRSRLSSLGGTGVGQVFTVN